MYFPGLQSLFLWLGASEHNADSAPAPVEFFPGKFRQADERVTNNYMCFCDFKYGHVVVNQKTELYDCQCRSGGSEFLDVSERPERHSQTVSAVSFPQCLCKYVGGGSNCRACKGKYGKVTFIGRQP